MTGAPIDLNDLLGQGQAKPKAPANTTSAINIDDLLQPAAATALPEDLVLTDESVKELLNRGVSSEEIGRILAIQRGGASPEDAEYIRRRNVLAQHPLFSAMPAHVQDVFAGSAAGGREVGEGIVEFGKRFVLSPPSLEILRRDLENWDNPAAQTKYQGPEGEISLGPQATYGSKETLQRLIHASISARNEGRELTGKDVAMAFIPPYATAMLLYGTASRLFDAPAALQGEGSATSKIQNFSQALTSGGLQLALVHGGAKEATARITKAYGIITNPIGHEIATGAAAKITHGTYQSSRAIIEQQVANDIANRVSAVNTWEATLNRARGTVDPELAGIKDRLINENSAYIASTVINAFRRLRPEDITIVPGIDRVQLVMERIKRSGVNEDNVAFHKRSDGSYDLALYGPDSPLAKEPDYLKQFRDEGWFYGQEASYQGKRVSYEGRSVMQKPGLTKIRDLDGGGILEVNRADLRRLPYTQSGSIKTEILTGYTPRDPFDVLAEATNGAPFKAAGDIGVTNISPKFAYIVDYAHDLMHELAYAGKDVGHNLNAINKRIDILRDELGREGLASRIKSDMVADTEGRLPILGKEFADASNNLPVFNEAQTDARRVAAAIGNRNFADALSILDAMKLKLEGRTTEEVSKYVADVHKPAKVRTFKTNQLFDEYYEGLSGKKAVQPGYMVMGSFNGMLNEIIMRPVSSYSAERPYEAVLSHEVAHAFGNRVISYNRAMAERILEAARKGDLSLVNPKTAEYIQWIDDQRDSGSNIYPGADDVLKEAITEELSHRYPVTPLKEMFQLYQTELRRATLNDLYTDFKAFHESIMNAPHTWESPITGNIRLPDISNLESGPLKVAIRSARKYFTRDEMIAEFSRVVAENKLENLVDADVMKQIDYYAQTLENFSLIQSFDLQVRHFAELRGIQRADIEGFTNFIGQKWAKELREIYLTPEELDQFNTVKDRMEVELGKDVSSLEVVYNMDQVPLAMEAASNGYRVQFEPNGDISLNKYNEIVPKPLRFRTREAAREFINQSGQQDTPNLSKPTNIPDQVGGAAMPPSGAKPPNSYGPNDGLQAEFDHTDAKTLDRGFFGHMLNVSRATLDMLTGREASFESVDGLFKTKFSNIQRRLEAAKGLSEANAIAFAKQYLEPIGKLMKGLNKEQFSNVFRYIEAMSSSELTGEMMGKGRVEAVEIARGIANNFHGSDLSRALEFARKVESIKKDLRGRPQDEVNLEIAKLQQAMNLSAQDVGVAGIFNGLKGRDINVVPIHEIVRLADALTWDAPNRDAFAKMANMGSKELAAAHMFDTLFEEAAKINGIPDYRKISGFIAHVRSQIGRDLPSPESAMLFQKGIGGTMEHTFVSEFVRTGELSAIELNPYLVALRYIDTAFKARDFVPVYKQALRDYSSELGVLDSTRVGRFVKNDVRERVTRYMSDLRGFPAPTNAMIRAGIEQLNKHTGSHISPTIVESLTSTIMKVTSGALLAFRPYIGLRHLAQFELFASARFGFKAMHEGLSLAEKPGAIEGLKSTGALSGLNYMSLVSPEEAATSLIVKHGGNAWKAYESIAKAGHQATLLPTIYEHTYAAVYLGMQKMALDNLTKLATGKLSKSAAYDALALDSFATAFRLDFDTVVRSGRVQEAAALIAKRAAKETIFDYQRANGPRGWNSVPGRFLTMFGTWPLHATELVNNMLTRGTIRHRINYAARFAMAQGAVWLAGRTIGLDLLGSTVAHSYFWSGSPQAQLLQTMLTAANGNGIEQKLAQDRLFKLVPFLKTSTMGGERRFEFDFDPMSADPRSMFVPGSYALGDWMQAVQEAKDPWGRYTTTQKVGRAIGVPTIKHKSWIDDYLDQLGIHQYDYRTTVPQE